MKKILIIEDDTDTIDMMEALLLAEGYAVIKVNRPITLKEIAGIDPHLIILDHWLSFGLGSDLCLELKSKEPTKHYPVILYSASNAVSQLARDSCADAFVEKPFDLMEIMALVARLAR